MCTIRKPHNKACFSSNTPQIFPFVQNVCKTPFSHIANDIKKLVLTLTFDPERRLKLLSKITCEPFQRFTKDVILTKWIWVLTLCRVWIFMGVGSEAAAAAGLKESWCVPHVLQRLSSYFLYFGQQWMMSLPALYCVFVQLRVWTPAASTALLEELGYNKEGNKSRVAMDGGFSTTTKKNCCCRISGNKTAFTNNEFVCPSFTLFFKKMQTLRLNTLKLFVWIKLYKQLYYLW